MGEYATGARSRTQSSRTLSALAVPVSARFSFERNYQDRGQQTDDSGFFGANMVAMSSKLWAGVTSSVTGAPPDSNLPA
nr:hypothetical protein BJQ95_00620 [Cryobacterium sp. SO1]